MATTPAAIYSLKGHDPLENAGGDRPFERDAAKLQVINILKCYTHYFDVFSESIQNALDAVEGAARQRSNSPYEPTIWIRVDVQNRIVRVVDNGVGMDLEQFKYCFRPNVSFKHDGEYRGQKGVGATFLAYGFSFIKLQTKQDGFKAAAMIRAGRQWVNDSTGTIPRPTFEVAEWDVPELQHEMSGTSVEITVGHESGERPNDLGWLGAQTAEQWHDVLRIRTPLGQVFLTGTASKPTITVEVIDSIGNKSILAACKSEYYYPHEIPGIKSAELRELVTALNRIDGDAQIKMRKLDDQYKRLNCLYNIWDTGDLLDLQCNLRIEDLSDEERILLRQHSVVVYGAFVNSLDVWDKYSDEILKLRRRQRILRGGLQMASDHMVQGDLIQIPLRRAIGYQHQCHVIVHFTRGNPDLGRKVFQPEYQALAEKIAVGAVQAFVRFRSHLRADTGTAQMVPDRELQNWIREQDDWRRKASLKIAFAVPGVSLVSNPREEQDVVALFHELIGSGVLRGYQFLSATTNDRYDALYEITYKDDSFHFDEEKNRLGISPQIMTPFESATQVVEYKYDLDSLARDFDRQIKFIEHVRLAVCWKCTGDHTSKFELRSLLAESAGETRQHFGATHKAYQIGSDNPAFEVIILEDLINYLTDPDRELARQKTIYGLFG
ncbi:MAG: ATP-binding protein [Bryobacteraceae bacterium]|jgi:hypothetical protein